MKIKNISTWSLILLGFTLATLLLVLYDTEMIVQSNNVWGSWNLFQFRKSYPAVAILVMCIVAISFTSEIKRIKQQQQFEDCIKQNEQYKQQFSNALSHSKSIYELALVRNDYELIIRAKHMIDNFGNKLELTELKGHPEVTNYLICKKIESENNSKVIFDFEICSDIAKLECIPASDINKVLGIVMDQITEAQKDSEDKEVGVLIRDEDEGTMFEYIYNGVLATQNQDSNVTSTNWHIINKIARKYGGKITAAQEDEYSIIRFWLPHDRPQCRILKTLGS